MVKYSGFDGLVVTPLELEFMVGPTFFKGAVVISNPPSGAFKIINIFRDTKGKICLEYDDTPM